MVIIYQLFASVTGMPPTQEAANPGPPPNYCCFCSQYRANHAVSEEFYNGDRQHTVCNLCCKPEPAPRIHKRSRFGAWFSQGPGVGGGIYLGRSGRPPLIPWTSFWRSLSCIGQSRPRPQPIQGVGPAGCTRSGRVNSGEISPSAQVPTVRTGQQLSGHSRRRVPARSGSTATILYIWVVVTWWASLLTGHLKMARAQVTGGRQGGNVDGQTTYEGVGKVEGCFNTFDVLLDVTFTPPDFLNNLKCRKLCASHRFCMSATTGSRCLCGNNFPSVFHRVSDDQCSNPCAPDRKTCETAACCGDRVGKYYSVSFAREIDVGLQLLRQLAMDYRTQNPIFQAYIESMMGSSAFLQVADFRTTAGYEGAGTAAATPMGSLGFGNGCPQGWTIFKRSCYRRFTGKLVSYQSARSSCQNQGATLPTVASVEENKFVQNMLGSQSGWLGLTTMRTGTWDWDLFDQWGSGEPSAQGSSSRGAAFGPGSGTPFNDLVEGVSQISQLSVGYSNQYITALQVTYSKTDGSVYSSPIFGRFTGLGVATGDVKIGPSQSLTKMLITADATGVRSMAFTLTDASGALTTLGPWGGTGAGLGGSLQSFVYQPSNPVIGLYGAVGTGNSGVLTQVGFFERGVPRCVGVGEDGGWKALDCHTKQDGMTFLCERRPAASRIDCEDGWVAEGGSCYQSLSMNRISWLEASAQCSGMGGALANIDSPTTSATVRRLMGGQGFIGLRDAAVKGGKTRQWGWQGFSKWAAFQPTAGKGCAMLDGGAGATWGSVDCTSTIHQPTTICEAEAIDTRCGCPSNDTSWQPFQCSCYLALPVRGGMTSWTAAAASCEAKGARLPDVRSEEENAFVASLANRGTVFLGVRDTYNSGKLSRHYYKNWAAAGNAPPNPASPADSDALCAVMRSDGTWTSTTCANQMGAYVCQTRMSSPDVPVAPQSPTSTVNNGEMFNFLPASSSLQRVAWGEPTLAHIQHATSGGYMAVDHNGRVYQTLSPSGERGKETLFKLHAVPESNAFLIQSLPYGIYMSYNASTGTLSGVQAEVNLTDYRPKTGVAGTSAYEVAADHQASAGQSGAKRHRSWRQMMDAQRATTDRWAPPEDSVATMVNGSIVLTRRLETGPPRALQRSKQAAATSPPTPQAQKVQKAPTGGTLGSRGSYQLAGAPTRPLPPPSDKYRSLAATPFRTSTLVKALALPNLQLSVVIWRSDTMAAPKLCTIFLYDLTANTDSYTCYNIQGPLPKDMPVVQMEVSAWIAQERTSILQPRSPLEQGRTRCENSSPGETVTCNVAYGEGLTFTRQLDMAFGFTYQFFFQINFGDQQAQQPGGYYNYQVAYTNTYTTTIQRSFVETRNWAVTVPIAPQSVSTIQFWLSTVEVQYAWQAILNAQGTFDISAMGMYLSTGQSITTLTYLEDLFLYTFGTYAFPDQAQVIITVDDIENEKYPFPAPSENNL